MIVGNNEIFNSPLRQIVGRVELFNGSTLTNVNQDGELQSIEISRVGENNKFFGFGITQKAILKLTKRIEEYEFLKGNNFKVYFDQILALPDFYISNVETDENTGALTITSYDALDKASSIAVSSLNLTSYNISELAHACANALGVEVIIPEVAEFELYYVEGANFNGTETLREVLNGIAEATQTIYFMNYENKLKFKRVNVEEEVALTIGKNNYFTLKTGEEEVLTTLNSLTDLGDNLSVSNGGNGATQNIRNNPFWDLREDRATLLENALTVVNNLTLTPFNCKWRGNYLLEPADKILLINKDNEEIISYLFNDKLTYNGGLVQETILEYTVEEKEHTNPTTIGEAIKETYAKVDKVNKEIDLVSSEVDANGERVGALEINTDSINLSVSNLDKKVEDNYEDLKGEIEKLKSVELTLTDEQFQIIVNAVKESGVDSVETSTGFKFNEDGLDISKTDSEMSTKITDDGMTVSKNDTVMLTANNTGVKARNLHAETYLIIGKNSRFEDWERDGEARTACFWIGN